MDYKEEMHRIIDLVKSEYLLIYFYTIITDTIVDVEAMEILRGLYAQSDLANI